MKLKDWKIIEGDALERLKGLPSNHFDASLSDPPYGLSFMGREWDRGVPSSEVYAELLRVLKPGAHIIHFGGTRTFHRLACSIEDAGFEIRDCLMWLYGSGFPKSHDISKAIDSKGGDPAQWNGYGTALKPAWEPAILARKPIDGTIANNALAWGVGGLGIDQSRVGDSGGTAAVNDKDELIGGVYAGGKGHPKCNQIVALDAGRWPSNVVVDEPAALALNLATREAKDRFFYCAKSQPDERNAGLDGMQARQVNDGRTTSMDNAYQRGDSLRLNIHPTVKPIDLIKYFAGLILPPDRGGGHDARRIITPYSGSGSEMIGCLLAGWDYAFGIEINPEYIDIAERRLRHWIEPPGSLFDFAARVKNEL
jgi:DNA modification methylase